MNNPDTEKKEKKSILGMTLRDLKLYCRALGHNEFHGDQIFKWIYYRLADDFNEMTDVPNNLREKLENIFLLNYLKPHKTLTSHDKSTIKYSFLLERDTGIEAVVLFDKNNRTSFCISSQAGCPIGCIYCATGKMGFIRNLTDGEIINEVFSLIKLHKKPDSVLFMGMGEPLLNYNNVTRAIELLQSAHIGAKKITVSTCGIVKKIYDLGLSGLRPRLAVSIGSAIEEKRKKIIPLSKDNDLQSLKKAIRFYREKTRRRVSIEYTLVRGINDTVSDARALATFARHTGTHVNIIRFNPVAGTDLSVPDKGTASKVKRILKERGIEVSERYRRGTDINAACGQLASH